MWDKTGHVDKAPHALQSPAICGVRLGPSATKEVLICQSACIRSPTPASSLAASGKNLIYKLVRAGELDLVKIGARSTITDESIQAFLERQKAKRAF